VTTKERMTQKHIVRNAPYVKNEFGKWRTLVQMYRLCLGTRWMWRVGITG
jgi:hypothetical protein